MAALVARHAKYILTFWVVVLFAVSPGLLKLKITPDNRIFYGERNPYYQELLEFEDVFEPASSISFFLISRHPIRESDDLVAGTRVLTQLAREMPSSTSVTSIATLPHIVSEGQVVNSIPLLDWVCPSYVGCALDREDLFRDPMIRNRLISEDLTSTSVHVALDLDIDSTDAVTSVSNAGKKLVVDMQSRYQNLYVGMTGTVPLMQAYIDATYQDLGSVLAIAMAVIFALILATLGGVGTTAVLISLGCMTIVATMGIAGYCGLVISTPTATIPMIVFTIVLAQSMHLIVHIVRASDVSGVSTIDSAIFQALNANWKPITLAAATTVAGLLSLISVNSPPIREIGIWSAVGVLLGTILTLSYVPAIISVTRPTVASAFQNRLQRLLNARARSLEMRGPSIVTMVLFCATGAIGILQLQIDDDFVRYLSAESSFRKDTDRYIRKFASPNYVDVWIQSSDTILNPDALAYLERLALLLRGDDRVASVLSVADLLVKVSVGFGNDTPISQQSEDAISQWYLVHELASTEGQSFGRLVSQDLASTRMTVQLEDVSARQVRELKLAIEGWGKSQSQNLRISVTGEAVPISHLSSSNIPNMALGIGASLLLTASLLGAIYRNLRVTIVALAATTIPVLFGFGIWGIAFSSIGLAATVVIAVTVGVVIDDAIHLIFKHHDGITKLDLDPVGAAAYSLHRVGTAVVSTTIVLCGGFLVMVFSDFQVNSTFGVCTGLILFSALIFDLYSLPSLLVWAYRKMPKQS